MLGPVVPQQPPACRTMCTVYLGLYWSPKVGEMVLSLRSPFTPTLIFERPKERLWRCWGAAGMGCATSLDPPVTPM